MMREIKFRVWDREDNKMRLVGAIDWDATCTSIITCNTQKNKLYFGYHENLNPIIMQYTGLRDKNGKEIYEGDIMQENKKHCYQVIWDENWAKFKLKHGRVYQYPEWNRGVEMEIIGNIYENPELMERSV